jgi:hypothetical protein
METTYLLDYYFETYRSYLFYNMRICLVSRINIMITYEIAFTHKKSHNRLKLRHLVSL